MTTTESIDRIKGLLADCRSEARKQGWTGSDASYEYTAYDMAWITGQLGYKPSREDWEQAGLRYVGSEHVASDD